VYYSPMLNVLRVGQYFLHHKLTVVFVGSCTGKHARYGLEGSTHQADLTALLGVVGLID
jgi:hypothetical protein